MRNCVLALKSGAVTAEDAVLPVITGHWWAIVLRGVVALLFALWAVAFPPLTIAVLAVLFAAYLIVDGVLAVIAGIRAAEAHRKWWPFALEGAANLIAGAIAFFAPALTVVVVIALVAAWAIVTGLLMLMPAFSLPAGTGRGWMILAGVASIVLGIAIIFEPTFGVLYIVWTIAAYAGLFGIGLIALGLRVRALHRAGPGLPA
jgi:uncharacterized membrane protein HdeD (DUF308 family)